MKYFLFIITFLDITNNSVCVNFYKNQINIFFGFPSYQPKRTENCINARGATNLMNLLKIKLSCVIFIQIRLN